MNAKLERELARELVAGLPARRRRALIERVRGNQAARRAWDRAIAGFRALERRSVSQVELDQVERWLFEDLAELSDHGVATQSPSRAWTWLGVGLATLASAAAVVWWISVDDPESLATREPDPFTARSGAAIERPLALDLVCGTPARPARDRGCELDELLGFSVRLGAEQLDPVAAAALAAAPLNLTVFGVTDAGEVRYYLPTPADLAPFSVELDSRWQPLPLSIRLDVNHAPGRVRVFALVSDAAPSVADVDRLAAALASEPAADVDTPPWHLRVDSQVLAPLCPDPDRCRSAEAELAITD